MSLKEVNTLLEKGKTINPTYILGVLFILVLLYFIYGEPPDNSDRTAGRIDSDIRQTGQHIEDARAGINEGKITADQIRQSNNALRESNSQIGQSIDKSIDINRSGIDLIKRGKQILEGLPTAEK